MNSTVSVHDLHPGDSLLWYRLERILRHDSSGVIYLATDTNLDRQVTIKEYIPGNIARRSNDRRVLPISEEGSDMYRSGLNQFIKEGQTLHRFNHPNIVQVNAVFEENNTAYMVMELVEGVWLRSYLRKTESISEARLKSLILPVAKGLAEVHRRGFIHGDINPWNIHVRCDGSPVLLDFVSNPITRKMTPQDPTLSTSACYEALEQFNLDTTAKQGPWTDIYALGGVLYFAISGVDPIDSRSRIEAISSGLRDPFVTATVIGNGKYSESFLHAVDWAMQLHTADRPKTIREWIKKGLSGDELEEEFSNLLTKPFGLPDADDDRTILCPRRDRTELSSEDFDASVSNRRLPDKYQRKSNRIIGFPTVSIAIILFLLVAIVSAIVTSK